MTRILVTDRQGKQVGIDAHEEQPLMFAIKDSVAVDNFGVCGGCRSCGTCHVYVLTDAAQLDPASAEEREMLEIFDNTRRTSRLSCQIVVRAELEGLAVEIAPEA